MLAESLAGIVAQQLLKTADGQGRVAALEILLGIPAVASLIREGKTFQMPSIIQANQAIGMQTMDMALERHLQAKKITAEAAYEKAADKELFAKYVKDGSEGLELG
jgi:twitching motility protein PilT